MSKTSSKTATMTAPRVARCKIVGVSPYSPGKAFPQDVRKRPDQTHDQFDEEHWRLRAHFESGRAVIPGTAIHKALIAAAKFRGDKIPGAGAKTWTKRFGAGCLVLEHVVIEPYVTLESLQHVTLHVPADGRPGGSTRVWKRFPIFETWRGEAVVTVVDGLIDEECFRRHLETAGRFVGLGRHRPSSQSPGTYGRFEVREIDWETID